MPRIDIMSLVGSAVPALLRADGHLACWYVVVEGVQRSGPYTSLDVATASKSILQQRFSHV